MVFELLIIIGLKLTLVTWYFIYFYCLMKLILMDLKVLLRVGLELTLLFYLFMRLILMFVELLLRVELELTLIT